MVTRIQKPNTCRSRVAIIGSGFGGFALAIRLQAAGFQVKIFEKRDLPGGRAYVFYEKGFTFDAGPTVITAPHCIEELFALADKDINDYVKLLPVKPFYRLLWSDGYQFDYSNDDKSLFEQIKRKNPNDVEGYQQFLEYSRRVFDEGYTKLAAEPFLNLWSMVKVAPQLITLKSHRSVYSVVSQFIQDEHLRQAFSFHTLLVGGNPFETSAIYALIHYLERNWGVFFPQGGTHALVRALERLFLELGGEVAYNNEIVEIVTHQNKVTGVKNHLGEIWPCQAVCSNGDIIYTYATLLKNHPMAQKRAAKLKKKSLSISLFLIYFGTKKRYPNLAHHTVIFGPRYKGLLDDIFSNGVLPEDFSLYLHAPTVTDPSLAPPGHECFYVLSPVAHLGDLPIDWDSTKHVYANKILTYLEKILLPNLSENIVVKKIITPLYFERDLNAYHGNAFSLRPTLWQSAYLRPHNKDDNIGGLYFVGAGTHPGAGVPGVINSAKATAKVILNEFSA
ncbi:MAG: phytoene desaturase [Bdellovibrionaceae bacterium]|nr:phytoene desaturase [Pseudobdellovibrionaceae bacterium]